MSAGKNSLPADYHRLFTELSGYSVELVLLTDSTKSIRYVNQRALTATGYRRDELLGRGIVTLFAGENRKKYVGKIFTGLRKAGRWEGELEFTRKNGSAFWGGTGVSVLPAPRSADALTLFVVRDLSDNRLASQHRWESETRIHQVLDGMEDAVYVCDPSGRIVMCNDACCRMTGYRPEEIVGMTMPYPWVEPSDRVRLLKGLKVLLKEGTLKNYVVSWRRRGAAPIVASLALHRMPEAGRRAPLVVVSARDVTDVQYADELRRAQEQMRRLVEDVKRKAEQLRTLRESNILVLRKAGVGRIFKAIIDGVRKIVEHDLAGIYVFDTTDQSFHAHTLSKQTRFSRRLASFPIPLGEGVVGAAARSGKLLWVNDAHLDPRSRYPEGMRPEKEHLIAVPLKGRSSIFGVLVVARNRDPQFVEEEALIVKSFADAALVALENANLHEELRHLRLPRPGSSPA